MSKIVTILFIGSLACAQQRAPGRVGGSPNNPQATPRPTRNAAGTTKNLTATSFVLADQDYLDVKKDYPSLTPAEYQRLQFLSEELKKRGIDQSPKQLERLLKEHDDNPEAALVAAGVSRKEARRIFHDSLK